MSLKVVGRKKKIFMSKETASSGEYGLVFNGFFGNTFVAVKQVNIQLTKLRTGIENLQSEIRIIKECSHQNVVKYLFDDEDDNFFYIVMEKCRSSLRKFFNKCGYEIMRGKLSQLQILFHATCGLTFLHSKNIIHRDIKMSNLLLQEEIGGVMIKFADFGLSKKLNPEQTSTETEIRGTKGYKAQEVLAGRRKIKLISDIFSLGILFHEMLTEGKHPFSDEEYEKDFLIVNNRPPKNNCVRDRELQELVKKMVEHSPDRRIQLRDVQHTIIKKHLGRDIRRGGKDYAFAVQELKKPISRELFPKWIDTDIAQREAIGESASKRAMESETEAPTSKKARNQEDALREYAKQRSIHEEQFSAKSHVSSLLKTAEKEAYLGHWSEAKANLDQGFASAQELGLSASLCDELMHESAKYSDCLLRAIFFKACAGEIHNCRIPKSSDRWFKIGECIYEIYCLLKDMIQIDPRTEMENVTYKNIAVNLVIPIMIGFDRKLKVDSQHPHYRSGAKNKAYALGWISHAMILVRRYKDAFKSSSAGIDIMNTAFPRWEDRATQRYVRLLDFRGISTSALGWTDTAKKILKTSLQFKKISNDYQDEDKKAESIESTERLLREISTGREGISDFGGS